jgi:hypothetical protein
MQKSAVVALFVSSASAMSLNGGAKFIDTQPSSFAQSTSMAAARAGSGVRAQWIELPDCSTWLYKLDIYGKPITGASEYIPLRDDLANSIIATCKGAEPVHGPNNNTDTSADTSGSQSTGQTTWEAKAATQIYDPVWKTATVIPDQEH